MPYIEEKARFMLEGRCRQVQTAGELNYAVTRLCLDYIHAPSSGMISYRLLNEVIGALECAKLEMYRRMVAPYEDEKIEQNGDVYPTT